jgi:hypothetical protein
MGPITIPGLLTGRAFPSTVCDMSPKRKSVTVSSRLEPALYQSFHEVALTLKPYSKSDLIRLSIQKIVKTKRAPAQ